MEIQSLNQRVTNNNQVHYNSDKHNYVNLHVWQPFKKNAMNRILFVIGLICMSCSTKTSINENLINCNQQLINKQLERFDMLYVTNPQKTEKYHKQARYINENYNKIKSELLSCKIVNDTLINNFIDYLGFIKIDTMKFSDGLAFRNISNIESKLIQLQYITLYSLMYLKESISKNEYSANTCRIECLKEGDRIQIIASLSDSTVYPNLMIGKLYPNKNRFVDSFIRPEISNGYGYISKKVLKNMNSVEGLYLLKKSDGWFDTIRFDSKIK